MLSNIKTELIKYFEQLRDKCKDPNNKAEIQKEIDKLNGLGINYGNYTLP